MNKPLIYTLFVSVILISGCVSTVNPVDPADITISVAPIEMKEFQEKEIPVNVMNNATSPIDSVSVKQIESFTVISGGNVNIPAKVNGPSSLMINARIAAPGFKDVENTSMLTLSYDSGKDNKGNPITKTKSVPVQATVLPDAKLQFVGFVKNLNSTTEAEVTTWEARAGDNVTITFSVKNDGKTTIDENSLKVIVDVDNKRMGTNNSLIIRNAMAKAGTSNTLAVQIQVPKDAPNGETDVYVTLLMNEKIIDSKTIKLRVKL
ncbi:MAG TPA: hypothetical protein VN368_02520 [Candidatus Methylomirabilis sp.]|nr:hypothetical protein [Candidatus Methylomirabilis sp.]